MGYLAPNMPKKKIRLKAKDPAHEAAGLRKRTYGMDGSLEKATTQEGNVIYGDTLRKPINRPQSPPPVISDSPVDASAGSSDPLRRPSLARQPEGNGADPTKGGVEVTPPQDALRKPTRYKSPLQMTDKDPNSHLGKGLDKFYRNNPSLRRRGS